MKFKLDENLSPELNPLFSQAGHEAHTVLEERLSGAKDDSLFARCTEEGRVLVTLDLDFSNPLRFPPEGTPGVIVLRAGAFSKRAHQGVGRGLIVFIQGGSASRQALDRRNRTNPCARACGRGPVEE